LVSDFGEVQSQNAMRKSTGATGTLSYCAPEVLRQEYPNGPFGNFTFKSDIFSLGMILYFLCFAALPYANADIINEEKEDLDQLRAEITSWAGFDHARTIRPDLPEKLYKFLERLLSVDPNRRPSAEEVLSGIQAGANVNANDNFRFRKASSAGPDLPGARIHPVDSPQPSIERALSPPKKGPRPSTNFRRDSMFDSSSLRASTTPAEDTKLGDSPLLIPNQDLVVRQRYSTSPPLSPTRRNHEESSIDGQSHSFSEHHLLAPPPSRFPFLTSLTTLYPSSHTLQFSLFFIKVVSTLHPCSPLTVNPWVLYPVLLSAVLALRVQSIQAQLLAVFVHLLFIGLGFRVGALCMWHRNSDMHM
jgi:serine/threonine protein kinase